jgi:hypothetical protein
VLEQPLLGDEICMDLLPCCDDKTDHGSSLGLRLDLWCISIKFNPNAWIFRLLESNRSLTVIAIASLGAVTGKRTYAGGSDLGCHAMYRLYDPWSTTSRRIFNNLYSNLCDSFFLNSLYP